MKRVIIVLLVIAFVFWWALRVNAQTTNNIQDACKAVAMDCSYNSRYDLIDKIYEASGQVMFDKQSNPYTKDRTDDLPTNLPRYYIGTAEQNAKLARNILANKELFRDGKLTTTAAKKWKMVK